MLALVHIYALTLTTPATACPDPRPAAARGIHDHRPASPVRRIPSARLVVVTEVATSDVVPTAHPATTYVTWSHDSDRDPHHRHAPSLGQVAQGEELPGGGGASLQPGGAAAVRLGHRQARVHARQRERCQLAKRAVRRWSLRRRRRRSRWH